MRKRISALVKVVDFIDLDSNNESAPQVHSKRCADLHIEAGLKF